VCTLISVIEQNQIDLEVCQNMAKSPFAAKT